MYNKLKTIYSDTHLSTTVVGVVVNGRWRERSCTSCSTRDTTLVPCLLTADLGNDAETDSLPFMARLTTCHMKPDSSSSVYTSHVRFVNRKSPDFHCVYQFFSFSTIFYFRYFTNYFFIGGNIALILQFMF